MTSLRQTATRLLARLNRDGWSVTYRGNPSSADAWPTEHIAAELREFEIEILRGARDCRGGVAERLRVAEDAARRVA